MINDPAILTGVVLSGAHGIFEVHTAEGVVRCTLRGKLKKAFARTVAKPLGKPLASSKHSSKFSGNSTTTSARSTQSKVKTTETEIVQPVRLSVGDNVRLRKLDETTGVIEEILPRKSELVRRDAASSEKRVVRQTMLANLDQVIIVMASAQPAPHFGMVDRYLAICESAELHPVICINKVDLPHEQYVEQAADLYRRLNYQVLWTSSQTGEGIDELRTLLQDHTSLFTGPSGVGKSSLVNAIEPAMAARTGNVSDATGKGRHTTTGSQLYHLSSGGWLADSAGIRALAAWNIPSEDLAWCFVEFRPYLGECIYSDCVHLDEEGCAIIQAVEDGIIDEGRYRSYTRMYNEDER